MLLVRLFVHFVHVNLCPLSLPLLVFGVGCGLWLRHSLDYSTNVFAVKRVENENNSVIFTLLFYFFWQYQQRLENKNSWIESTCNKYSHSLKVTNFRVSLAVEYIYIYIVVFMG